MERAEYVLLLNKYLKRTITSSEIFKLITFYCTLKGKTDQAITLFLQSLVQHEGYLGYTLVFTLDALNNHFNISKLSFLNNPDHIIMAY